MFPAKHLASVIFQTRKSISSYRLSRQTLTYYPGVFVDEKVFDGVCIGFPAQRLGEQPSSSYNIPSLVGSPQLWFAQNSLPKTRVGWRNIAEGEGKSKRVRDLRVTSGIKSQVCGKSLAVASQLPSVIHGIRLRDYYTIY